jgi:hypothetical protein
MIRLKTLERSIEQQKRALKAMNIILKGVPQDVTAAGVHELFTDVEGLPDDPPSSAAPVHTPLGTGKRPTIICGACSYASW